MKKYILFLVAIAAVSVTSCRKIEEDGEIIYIPQPGGGGGGTGSQTITLQGRIDSNITLLKQNNYILKGPVYMINNKTMTIEAGTTIKGSFSGSDVATLVITRGSKIVAQGAPTDPIIFTSASPNPQSGDWGGIVLCGKAAINTAYNGTTGLYQVEGGIDNANGDGLAGSGDAVAPTPVNDDSSGVLSYVRIQYAGYAFQPDKEINSLTMAGVGSKTVIDHVQVTYAKDDAFEWFGGTVNAKYLIAYKTQDDDFDTDNGYSGKVQFGLIIRDSLIADVSKSESFESDNNSSGGAVSPKTSAIFSNITSIGPRATLSNVGNSNFLAGAQIRRNSSISIFNAVFMGWPTGIIIDAQLGSSTALNIADSSLRLRNISLVGNTNSITFVGTGGGTITNTATLLSWFTSAGYDNDIVTTVPEANLIQPFNYASPDPTPFGSGGTPSAAKIRSGAAFADAKFTGDTFFDKTVTFRGAIAPAGAYASWWKGWTIYN